VDSKKKYNQFSSFTLQPGLFYRYFIALLQVFLDGFVYTIAISNIITAFSSSPQGAQIAINQTGQFVSNVTEKIAENPIATNITGETQGYFTDKSK
jgi:hypothetical protein